MASVPATFPAFRIHSDDAGYRSGIDPVSLDDLAPGATLHLPAAEVRSVAPGAVSLMPPGLDQVLSPRELADLVRFLKERQ